jgi:hypothetical protein
MGPRAADIGAYPSASAVCTFVYGAMSDVTAETSAWAAARWLAVGGADGTGAITIPLAITVAPWTSGQMELLADVAAPDVPDWPDIDCPDIDWPDWPDWPDVD